MPTRDDRGRLAARRFSHPGLRALLSARLVPASFSGLPLTLVCLGGFLVIAGLAGLVDNVRELDGIVRLDAGVNAALTPYRTPSAIAVFVWITALGAGPAICGMAVVAAVLIWSQGQARLIVPLGLALLGAEATTWAGKYAIGRARPAFLDAITAASPSFPSGHATASTALIGFLAYAAARNLPLRRARVVVLLGACVVIGLICFSRLFLSLHYLSDVAAGVLVGIFWLLASISAAELRRRPP